MKKLLFIGCVFLLFITGCNDDSLIESDNQTPENYTKLTNIPVNIIYNEEAYVIEGDKIPDSVDIVIYENYDSEENFPQITLDLTEYAESDSNYKAYFTCSNCGDDLSYKISPEYVNVEIKKKISMLKTVDLDIINQDKQDMAIKSVSLVNEEVIIKGSESSLEKVALIKATVDLGDINLSNTDYYTLNTVPLMAYDKSGDVLDKIEIVPGTTSAFIIVDKDK